MSDRVRAVLFAPDDRLLTIKRIKGGRAPYWVLPGGGVEPTDPSLEDALQREIREELAGRADVHSLLQILQHGSDCQYIYLARINRWEFANRTGPEFTQSGRGEYVLEQVPLVGLSHITLVPPETAALLTHKGLDVFGLPDLRGSAGHLP